MVNEFMVVGEYREDDRLLLVLGADGQYYSYHPRRKRLMRVKLDEKWVLHSSAEHLGTGDAGRDLQHREEPGIT